MLSPIITTIGKSNLACQVFISSPISYCGLSPVPLSPMMANFKESGLFGSVAWPAGASWCATAVATAARGTTTPATQRIASTQTVTDGRDDSKRIEALTRKGWSHRSRKHVLHIVRDHVGTRIEQDQSVADETVLELLGELGKTFQNLWWDGRQGYCVRIPAVDLHGHGRRVLLQDLFFQL